MNNKIINFLIKYSWTYPPILLFGIFVFGIYLSNTNAFANLPSTDYVSSSTSIQSSESVSNESESELLSEDLNISIKENGNYTSKEELALYIHTFKKLPNNYISKKDALLAGWNPSKDNLDTVLPGMSIGGDEYGNINDKLPKSEGRHYFEADVDYTGGSRTAKKLIYSSDGLIFYTEDSYESFERLY